MSLTTQERDILDKQLPINQQVALGTAQEIGSQRQSQNKTPMLRVPGIATGIAHDSIQKRGINTAMRQTRAVCMVMLDRQFQPGVVNTPMGEVKSQMALQRIRRFVKAGI